MGVLDWLYGMVMFLLLFITVVGAYTVIFTRFDPAKEELTKKSYNIGCLAGFTLILLAFLRAIIG